MLNVPIPNVLTVFEDKLIIVTDSRDHQFHICSKDFTNREDRVDIKSFKMEGYNPQPRGVATNGEYIFIANSTPRKHINRYTMDGKLDCVSRELFDGCCGITIYEDKLYVANNFTKREIDVLNLDFKHCPPDHFKGLDAPRDVAVASNGTIYVSESNQDCVKVFKKNEFEKFTDHEVVAPAAICIYKKENKEYILVASHGHGQPSVFVFSSSGKLLKHFKEEKIGKLIWHMCRL